MPRYAKYTKLHITHYIKYNIFNILPVESNLKTYLGHRYSVFNIFLTMHTWYLHRKILFQLNQVILIVYLSSLYLLLSSLFSSLFLISFLYSFFSRISLIFIFSLYSFMLSSMAILYGKICQHASPECFYPELCKSE